MSIILRKLIQSNTANIIIKHNDTQVLWISCRKLSIVPSLYDGDKDPAPKFFSSTVQVLLKRLTRPDHAKVFRKTTNKGIPVLKTPKYKFLTTEELDAELDKANFKAERLLQMPPVVKVQKPITDVLSQDPALMGYDKAKYLFTDITFGVDNSHRMIVERDPDGTLKNCDHDMRKKLNQVYFPTLGRRLNEPLMFSDQEKLHNLLDREEYEFVLNRACVQYEPDEPKYQTVTSIAYQHLDALKKYNILRSTRHFGPLVFYLTWHQSLDSLMLDLLQSGAIREAVLLMSLQHEINGDVLDGSLAKQLTKEILPTPVQLSKPEQLTEEDIRIDTKCVDCVASYIKNNSAMKSQQELALQGFREHYQQLIELSRGLKKAHGTYFIYHAILSEAAKFYSVEGSIKISLALAEKKAIKNGVHHAIFTSRFDRYVGDWHGDKKQGKGLFLTITGKLYEGDWLHGYRHGFGTLSYRQENGVFQLKYRGQWVRGKPEGVGWWWHANGDIYFGYWRRGRRDGFGKMWYADGTFYVGYWIEDLKTGIGMFVQQNGNRYEGNWEGDAKSGYGRFYFMHTGQLQEGCWVDDVCVKSKITDIIIRQFGDLPTQYPIPPVELQDSRKILEESELWLQQKIGDTDKRLEYCIDQMY